MIPQLWILDSPWDLVNGRANPFNISKDLKSKCIDTKSLHVSMLIPDNTFVSVGGSHFPIEKQSSIIFWEEKFYRKITLPIGSFHSNSGSIDLEIRLNYNNESFEFTLRSTFHTSPEIIKQFLCWQIDCFQRMVHLDSDCLTDESKVNGGLRRSWNYVHKVWLRTDIEENEAQISLIVKLAQNKLLLDALKAILSEPNKTLKRQRTLVNVGSVSQMDSACIRWYVRQPGHSLQEKAGTKQQILAVTRKESFDLLENRVSHWVANRLIKLSNSFFSINQLHAYSDKYALVKNLNSITSASLKHSPLKDIQNFGHCLQPNNSLRYHHHYHQIWKTYLKLRNEERLIDNCWTWQTILWTETCRQILGGILTYLSRHSTFLSELSSSMLYLNFEQHNGIWTNSPISPGPFKTIKGIIDYIDLRDGAPNPKVAHWMELIGCHQILLQKLSDGSQKILAIWFWHQAESEEDFSIHLDGCQKTLINSHNHLEGIKVAGLIILSEINNNSVKCQQDNRIDLKTIRLPQDFHDDFKSIIKSFKEVLSFFN